MIVGHKVSNWSRHNEDTILILKKSQIALRLLLGPTLQISRRTYSWVLYYAYWPHSLDDSLIYCGISELWSHFVKPPYPVLLHALQKPLPFGLLSRYNVPIFIAVCGLLSDSASYPSFKFVHLGLLITLTPEKYVVVVCGTIMLTIIIALNDSI